jgi:hypothetical protein
MKFVVPLRMPSSETIWLAERHWLMLAMIGMPPATAASNAIERPSSRAAVEQLRAMLGQQGLVGGDDVLAAFQQPQHDRPLRLQAADELATTVISGSLITSSTLSVSTPLRQFAACAGLFAIADDGFSSHSVRPAWRAVRSP